MKLIITGAGSFIADSLLKSCDDHGHQVHGLDLLPPARSDCYCADINDPALHQHLPDGYDTVIHLAAMARDSDCRDAPNAAFIANVIGTLNVLEAAAKRDVKRFILASTEWVYDGYERIGPLREDMPIDPHALPSAYGQSKLLAEAALHHTAERLGIGWAALRLGIVYGPRQKNWGAVEALLSHVIANQPVTVGSLRTARRYIEVRDVAAALLNAAGSDFQGIVNIQGPRLVDLGEILDIAKALTGHNVAITEDNPDNPSIRVIAAKRATEVLNWEADIDIRAGMDNLHRYLLESSAA